MLKIHSFLQRVKKPIRKILPNNIGKYKMQFAVIAYMMVTILFILSPDYIYGASSKGIEKYAKADLLNLAPEIQEETAKEAIIRTNQILDSKFILCNLTSDRGPIGQRKQTPLKLMLTEVNHNGILLGMNSFDSKRILVEKDYIANSDPLGADADETVDSGSTNDKKSQETNDVAKKNEDTKEIQNEKSKESKNEKKKGTNDTKKKTTVTKNEKEKETKKDEKKAINLSKSDIEVLQRIVEAEATGENVKGKILVANVILNRVKDKDFPDTVKGVVFQRDGGTYQFSPIKDNRYWSVRITKETVEAVERVMQGEDYSNGALYFSARSRADRSSMRWFDNHLKFLFEYGGHEFFKDK